jgi:hypothetical protein
VCLDTGVITLQFSKSPPSQVQELFEFLKKGDYIAFIIPPVLIEAYREFAEALNKSFAENCIDILLDLYPINLVHFDKHLLFRAGQLKVQYHSLLSTVDAMILAFGILNKIEIHTTEKTFPTITNLKVIKYYF